MKLCTKHGCGVCIGCSRVPPKGCGEVCRYEAEKWLDLLSSLLDTELTHEQGQIVMDFKIVENDTE